MNSAVRSSGGKRDEVVLGHWSFNEGAGELGAPSPYPYPYP